MSEIARVFTGADIHDGTHLHHGKVLAQMQVGSRRILAFEDVPQGVPTERLQAGVLCPGFVDLQVNGGGGVMFNDSPDVATLRRLVNAGEFNPLGATDSHGSGALHWAAGGGALATVRPHARTRRLGVRTGWGAA